MGAGLWDNSAVTYRERGAGMGGSFWLWGTAVTVFGELEGQRGRGPPVPDVLGRDGGKIG